METFANLLIKYREISFVRKLKIIINKYISIKMYNILNYFKTDLFFLNIANLLNKNTYNKEGIIK